MDENLEINPYLITVVDENGEEHIFEELDRIELTDDNDVEQRYVAVTPYEPNPDEILESYDELIILKVEEDEDGETFLSAIEDQDEFDEIGQIFEERLSEYYEIAEDDE
ncbi:MAG: DUF1292 domain-containing protein [Oscillospiraceae bacterium]|nr:DUF1292 domain-containing protein [Oscillospiraceae bacterium]